MQRVDNRGLAPPEPLERTLGLVERLSSGERLEVVFDRRPMLLLPLLDQRGFRYSETVTADGVHLVISRA